MKRREFLNIGLLTLGGVLVGRILLLPMHLLKLRKCFGEPILCHHMI